VVHTGHFGAWIDFFADKNPQIFPLPTARSAAHLFGVTALLSWQCHSVARFRTRSWLVGGEGLNESNGIQITKSRRFCLPLFDLLG
jgi:hypothetical protein